MPGNSRTTLSHPLHPKNSLLLHLRFGDPLHATPSARPAFGQDVLQVLERALAEMSPTELHRWRAWLRPSRASVCRTRCPHHRPLRVQALKELNAGQAVVVKRPVSAKSRLPMPACSPSWG